MVENLHMDLVLDFRRAYATVLSGWFGVQPEKVLGAPYEAIPFLKA